MSSQPVSIALALSSALAFALPLPAQTPRDSTRLPTVVVTADRLPMPLGTTTSTVTVIEGDALRAAGVSHLLDALRSVPGVSVARAGSQGAQTSIFLRGGESDYVRVLIDGIPMNDAGGAIDLATYTSDNVERIEIVRGPASVLYGSDAVTGVIQIFTRRARERVESRMAISAGSYGSSMVDASAGFRSQRAGLTASVARHAGDGTHPFNSEYRNTVASARGDVALPGEIGAALVIRHWDNVFHYPTDGAGQVVDHNAHRGERRLAANVELSRPLGNSVEVIAVLSALDARGRTSDRSDGPGDTLGLYDYRSTGVLRRRVAEARANLAPFDGQTVTLGVEWSLEGQRSADSSNFDASLNRFSAARRTRSAFLQLVGDRGPLSYSVGGRYDDNDTYGSFRTARVGSALRLWRGARVHAALGTAFKAPAFLETFSTAFSVGNPALRPERSRGWELGVEQRLLDGRAEFSATWFDQKFRDLIQYTFASPASPNYFNVAAASSRGLELEVRAQLMGGFALRTGSTFLRTRVDDAGFQSGAGATFVRGGRLLRRPPSTVSLGAIIDRIPRTYLDVNVLRVSERDDRDFAGFPAEPVVLDPYTRVDLGGEYRVRVNRSRWNIGAFTLRLENAFGARYGEIAGFPAPGRAVRVGLRFGNTL